MSDAPKVPARIHLTVPFVATKETRSSENPDWDSIIRGLKEDFQRMVDEDVFTLLEEQLGGKRNDCDT